MFSNIGLRLEKPAKAFPNLRPILIDIDRKIFLFLTSIAPGAGGISFIILIPFAQREFPAPVKFWLLYGDR